MSDIRPVTFVVGNFAAGDRAGINCDFADAADDETAIQAAINNLTSEGGRILIRRGTYIIANTVIRNLSNIRITGEGKGNTTLQRASAITFFVFGDGSSNFKNLEISHLTIDATSFTGIFFNIKRYDDVNVHHCEFEGNSTQAFNFGFSPQSKIQFIDNVFRNLVSSLGVIRVGGSHVNFIFIGNLVLGGGAAQFLELEASTLSIIANNHFDSVFLGGTAIKIEFGGSRVIIKGNTFQQYATAIDLVNGDEVQIDGNIFDACTTAIDVAAASLGVVIQNNKTIGVTFEIIDLAIGTIVRGNSWQHGFVDIDVDDTPFSAGDDEHIRADTATGAGSPADITVNLPAAAKKIKQYYTIKKISGVNKVTIDPNASETIDGNSTIELLNPQETLRIVSDGSNWTVVQ